MAKDIQSKIYNTKINNKMIYNKDLCYINKKRATINSASTASWTVDWISTFTDVKAIFNTCISACLCRYFWMIEGQSTA